MCYALQNTSAKLGDKLVCLSEIRLTSEVTRSYTSSYVSSRICESLWFEGQEDCTLQQEVLVFYDSLCGTIFDKAIDSYLWDSCRDAARTIKIRSYLFVDIAVAIPTEEEARLLITG